MASPAPEEKRRAINEEKRKAVVQKREVTKKTGRSANESKKKLRVE